MHNLTIDLIMKSDFWMCLGGVMALVKVLLVAGTVGFFAYAYTFNNEKGIPLSKFFRPWQWAVGLLALGIPMAIRFGLPEDNFFQFWDVTWIIYAPAQSLGLTPDPKYFGPITVTVAWVIVASTVFLLYVAPRIWGRTRGE